MEAEKKPSAKIRVGELWVYPVKGCRGVALSQATITPNGFQFDRQWMVVNERWVFVTARQYPQMLLVAVHLGGNPEQGVVVELTAPGMPQPLLVPSRNYPAASSPATVVEVKVWEDMVQAYDCGEEASAWLTTYFRPFSGDGRFHLVEVILATDQSKGSVRGCSLHAARNLDLTAAMAQRHFTTTLTDGYPYTVLSEASVRAVNEAVHRSTSASAHTQARDTLNDYACGDFGGWEMASSPQPPAEITSLWFRPNIVVTGVQTPFEEDQWACIETEGQEGQPQRRAMFLCVKACARCKVTTINPDTAKVLGDDELAPKVEALSEFSNALRYLEHGRDFGRGPLMAQNAVCLNLTGTLRVGDEVTVLRHRTEAEVRSDRTSVPRPKNSGRLWSRWWWVRWLIAGVVVSGAGLGVAAVAVRAWRPPHSPPP